MSPLSNYKIVYSADDCNASSVLTVTAANHSGNSIVLGTATQLWTNYMVCVFNVLRYGDGASLTTHTAVFSGTGTGSPFSVSQARSTGRTNLVVIFNAEPNNTQASNAANYKIVPGASDGTAASVLGVTAAAHTGGSTRVMLTTANQPASNYRV